MEKSLLVHPDKNQESERLKQLANEAFLVLDEAYKEICPKSERNTIPKTAEEMAMEPNAIYEILSKQFTELLNLFKDLSDFLKFRNKKH